MRFAAIFFLFQMLCIGIRAQERIELDFESEGVQLSQKHHEDIRQFIADKKVKEINISGFYSPLNALSSNRIKAEFRVSKIKTLLLIEGVPVNKIHTRVLEQEDKNATNQVVLNAFFEAKKGKKVLKKSTRVEISEIDYTPPAPPVKIIKKPEEKKGVLNVADFKKNSKIELKNLLFEPGLHLMIPSSRSVLYELLAILKENPKLKIELQGHICCQRNGADAYDPVTGEFNLSIMRAKTVYNFLVNQGISADRMRFKGFASTRKKAKPDLRGSPGDPMQILRNQQINRRVEVLVLSVD